MVKRMGLTALILLLFQPVAWAEEETSQPRNQDDLCPALLRMRGQCVTRIMLTPRYIPTNTTEQDLADEASAPHRSLPSPLPLEPIPPWPQPELTAEPLSDGQSWTSPTWDAPLSAREPAPMAVPFVPSQDRFHPAYGRAATELVVSLGIGTAWYWSNTNLNSLDWDYTWRWNSQRNRHANLSGWRFDDNTLHLNSPGHPLAGGAYYALARANGFSIPASFALSMLTGTLWEILIEYKEVVSLNDLVLTGVAGVPLGEAFHQLGAFFRRSYPTASNQLLSWIFGLPVRFHHWLDGTATPRASTLDERGWPGDVIHRFELGLGASVIPSGESEDRQGLELNLRGELIDMNDYDQPGKDVTWHRGPLFTGMGLGATITPRGVEDFVLDAKLTFAGFHARRIEENVDTGALEGFNLFFGSTIAFLHDEYDFAHFRDRLGAVHLPGLSMHLRVFGENVELRYGIDFHPDFAAVQSAAMPSFDQPGSRRDTRSILDDHGYYFAWGFTRNYRLELAYKSLNLRTHLSRQNYRSIDGYDRFQFDLADDVSVADQRTTRETVLEVKLPRANTFVGLSSQRRQRTGTLEDVDGQFEERRLIGRLRFAF
jgi:hypothetical protein